MNTAGGLFLRSRNAIMRCDRDAMRRIARLLAFVSILVLHATPSSAIEIVQRVSVKYILSGAGAMPAGEYSDSSVVKTAIDSTNYFLRRFGRGYRYELMPFEIVPGASQYFNLFDLHTLENAAETDTVKYHWHANALNIYMVQSASGSAAAAAIPSNPPDAGYRVMYWSCNQDTVYRNIGFPHEMGHHNDLYHPFETGGPCADDCVSDTRPEPSPFQCTAAFACTTGGNQECCCSTKDFILALTAVSQGWTSIEVNNIRWNCMGYFGANDCHDAGLPFTFSNMLFTDDQWDRWTDATRRYNSREVTGLTWFVDAAGNSSGDGYSTGPFSTVQGGLSHASTAGTDIVMIRSGNYPGALTINQHVTLRACRGNAVLGQ
jgi:hypothetical protein